MERLNEILHELGISKVKLAKFLGVSRQMIYNYLDLDDLNKWPKDKKVLLLNLLGVKSVEEINSIKVNTDYILDVESRVNSLFEHSIRNNYQNDNENIYENLDDEHKEIMSNIINLMKEQLEDDDKKAKALITYKYLYHFMQTMETSHELKYILGYMAKAAGFIKPLEFAYNEEEQFIFESILFSAMRLYQGGGVSRSKIAESHRRFVNQIEQKMEEKLSRTLELNTIKVQALKELGFTEINEENASEVFSKIAEIQSRKVS
ncbi:MAG: hypothetical protein PHN42_04030 [Bacilli bacterium]|nr:hypothetical protein [Bacilli bacterium]